jgi:carotenoid cleavage dioxygenase-like enzyme
MPSPIDPTNPPSTEDDLDVRGALPLALAGRLVGIGRDGFVHSFHFDRGQVSYLARRIGMGAAVTDLVAFEDSILVYGEDSLVRQLILEVGTPRRVDLAGNRRTVAACPKYDPASGELHLVARDWGGAQMHVVVPAGALTRRSRLVVDARARIQGLAIGTDHVVFVADGVAGVTPRDGEVRTTWMPTDVAAPWPVHTYRAGDTIIVVALTPSLERWILHPDGGTIEREVLDPTARHFARSSGDAIYGMPRFVWSTGGETIGRHDLVESRGTHLNLAPHAPRDFVVVPDAARPGTVDAGWFVGFVQHASGSGPDLWVIDTADLAGPAIATIRVPRPIPHGLRCTWMPATQQMTRQQSPSPKEVRP